LSILFAFQENVMMSYNLSS